MHLVAYALIGLLGGSLAAAPASPTAPDDLMEPASYRHAERLPPGRTAGDQQDKKKKKKKKKGKKETVAPALPEWKHTDAPFSDFIWMARQLPDFEGFPSRTEKITLSIVAPRKKTLLFLDSCKAERRKKGWRVQNCNALRIRDKDFLARLVRGGTDTKMDPNSLKKLKQLTRSIRKSGKLKKLEQSFTEASKANKEGYRLADDVEGDIKSCGAKRYFKALATMPSPTFVGSNVVVIDVSYVIGHKANPFKVDAALVRTDGGWRVGGLRVHCY